MDNVKFFIGIVLCVIAAINFLLSGVVELIISLPVGIVLLILGIILIATGRKQK